MEKLENYAVIKYLVRKNMTSSKSVQILLRYLITLCFCNFSVFLKVLK